MRRRRNHADMKQAHIDFATAETKREAEMPPQSPLVRRASRNNYPDVAPGMKVGRLLVEARAPDRIIGARGQKFVAWTCRCDCGVRKVVLDQSLRKGASRSCGCLRRDQLRANPPLRGRAGPENPKWKGGRHVDRRGYVEVWIPKGHRFWAMARSMTGQGGYVFEHRLRMAESLGRALESREEVHHIDGNRQNNEPANLQLRTTPQGAGVVAKCRACGSCDIVYVPIADAPEG